MCRKLDGHIDHIFSGCSKLAQKEHKRRHDNPEKKHTGSLIESVVLKAEINGMNMSQKVL